MNYISSQGPILHFLDWYMGTYIHYFPSLTLNFNTKRSNTFKFYGLYQGV